MSSSGCSCFWGPACFKEVLLFQKLEVLKFCYSKLKIQCMELYLTATCLTTICIFKISCKNILDKISLVKQLNC